MCPQKEISSGPNKDSVLSGMHLYRKLNKSSANRRSTNKYRDALVNGLQELIEKDLLSDQEKADALDFIEKNAPEKLAQKKSPAVSSQTLQGGDSLNQEALFTDVTPENYKERIEAYNEIKKSFGQELKEQEFKRTFIDNLLQMTKQNKVAIAQEDRDIIIEFIYREMEFNGLSFKADPSYSSTHNNSSQVASPAPEAGGKNQKNHDYNNNRRQASTNNNGSLAHRTVEAFVNHLEDPNQPQGSYYRTARLSVLR